MRTFALLSALLLLPATAPAAPQDAIAAKAPKGKRGAVETPPPPPPDSDGDGISDDRDGCPDAAEDLDLFKDEDGCPDPDNDGDGVLDADDGCPFEAETVNGFRDADGCPEAPPAIPPMRFDARLVDGTTLGGTLVRVIAVDEDEAGTPTEEPADFDVALGETELTLKWSQLRSLKAEKVKFADGINCYSEGVSELDDARETWECTLSNPTVVGMADKVSKDKKVVPRFLDRRMRRIDLVLDGVSCEGPSCASVQDDSILSVYLYNLIRFEQGEDEAGTLAGLQQKLRDAMAAQIESATLAPVQPAE